MSGGYANRVVHLELHTSDLERATAFYAGLCGWQLQSVETGAGAYLTLDLGSDRPISGGAVACPTPRPLWLPYVEVGSADGSTARAVELGARVLLPPREGPAGFRSVVAAPSGGEIAFWQPK
jgi:predicted enzyme related to lactoylglutathione lyase